MRLPETLVVFQAAGRRFAIDAAQVKQLRGTPLVTPLPRTPRHLLGVFHHEGRVLPLFDLIHAIDHDDEVSRPRVMIVEHKGYTIGVVVENIIDVLPPEDCTITSSPLTGTSLLSRLVLGQVQATQAGQEKQEEDDGHEAPSLPSKDPEPPQDEALTGRLNEILDGAPDWLRRIHLRDDASRAKDIRRRVHQTIGGEQVLLVDVGSLWDAASLPDLLASGGEAT
jgi:purine-binding chemotaxis protein CheW